MLLELGHLLGAGSAGGGSGLHHPANPGAIPEHRPQPDGGTAKPCLQHGTTDGDVGEAREDDYLLSTYLCICLSSHLPIFLSLYPSI